MHEVKEKITSYLVVILQKFDRLKRNKRLLAQLVERLPYKQRVIGSNPVGPKIFSLKTLLNFALT